MFYGFTARFYIQITNIKHMKCKLKLAKYMAQCIFDQIYLHWAFVRCGSKKMKARIYEFLIQTIKAFIIRILPPSRKNAEIQNTKSKTSVISNAKFISNTFGLNSMHEIATVLQNKYLRIVVNYNSSFTITVLCYNLKIIEYYDNT